MERLFTAYLQKTISVRDTFVKRETKENFYHGILLGILGCKEGWYVSSDKEAGNGYSDIQIEIEDEKKIKEYKISQLKFKPRYKKEKIDFSDDELKKLEILEKKEGKSKLDDN